MPGIKEEEREDSLRASAQYRYGAVPVAPARHGRGHVCAVQVRSGNFYVLCNFYVLLQFPGSRHFPRDAQKPCDLLRGIDVKRRQAHHALRIEGFHHTP